MDYGISSRNHPLKDTAIDFIHYLFCLLWMNSVQKKGAVIKIQPHNIFSTLLYFAIISLRLSVYGPETILTM